MDGHATSVGGCIVDSGNFDWDAHAEKFPGLCTPDESYHGLTYTKAFGKGAYITKATAQLMRDLGSIQSPQNSFLLNLGLETLHLRMPQHCRNAQKVAEYLSKNESSLGKLLWSAGQQILQPGTEIYAERFLRSYLLWSERRT